jgi:hypothetical protein
MRYGQRGGDGPNTGKKKATYAAHAPDGKLLKIGTFHYSLATGWMHMYQHDGAWFASMIRGEPKHPHSSDTGHWAEAIRIT